MEDRYLCKAKRTDNGEWVEGYLIVDEKDYSKYFIGYVLGTNEDGTPHDLDAAQVNPSTICQCTGYEGIYEKDIFRYEDEDYVIKWSDDSLRWEATSLETDVSVPLGDINPDYIDVIGNEIDNPELLEV